MAEIAPNMASKSAVVNISNGETIRISILNADGTLKVVLIDDQIPMGKAFNGSSSYSGTVANV